MDFKNAKYENADEDLVRVECNGKEMVVAADPQNRHYAEMVRQNVPIASYQAPARKEGDFAEFMNLFTPEEQIAVAGAALVNVPIKLWYDQAVAANRIDLESQKVQDGTQALVDAALLTAERRTEILGANFDA